MLEHWRYFFTVRTVLRVELYQPRPITLQNFLLKILIVKTESIHCNDSFIRTFILLNKVHYTSHVKLIIHTVLNRLKLILSEPEKCRIVFDLVELKECVVVVSVYLPDTYVVFEMGGN